MPATPTLTEVLVAAFDSRLRELHTGMPGKVKSYDAATQRADVIPVVQAATPASDGSTVLEDLPVLPNVPVRWPKAGGCYLHFPMAAGDWVQLIFNEAAIGQWRATGQVPAPPGDLTRHGLSYAVALPCSGPDDDLFTDAPAGEGVIVVDDVLRISSAGGTADFVARADKVDLALSQLKTMLLAFTTTTTPAAVEPTLATASSTLAGSLGSWLAATVGATKLKAE